MDATYMTSQADHYYLNVAGTVDHVTLTMWDDAIRDVKAMDIYAT